MVAGLWALKDPFVFSIKAERGKRGTGYGGREVRGLPPVRSTLRNMCWDQSCVYLCVCKRERERERERVNKCVSDSWMQAS